MKIIAIVAALLLAGMAAPAFGQVAQLPNTTIPTQCIDLNQDRICEAVVLANGTMINFTKPTTVQIPEKKIVLPERCEGLTLSRCPPGAPTTQTGETQLIDNCTMPDPKTQCFVQVMDNGTLVIVNGSPGYQGPQASNRGNAVTVTDEEPEEEDAVGEPEEEDAVGEPGNRGSGNNDNNEGQSPYNSGYSHGCDDASESPSDRYINEAGKGKSHHTPDFNRGYDAGFNSCGGSGSGTGGGSSSGKSLNDLANDLCNLLDNNRGKAAAIAAYLGYAGVDQAALALCGR